jgi:flagella basal body P-ring formation protein FlgA
MNSLWAWPSFAGERPCLVLAKEAEVEKGQIILRDLASEICSGNERLSSLLAISLGRAPLPGETRNLDRDYILMKVRQGGHDPRDIETPERIEVKRASFEVTAEYLEGIIRRELFPRLPWDKDGIIIRSVKADRSLILPKGDMEIEVSPPRMGGRGGSVNTSVLFRVDKTYEKRLWISLQLEVPGEVVAAARPLKRNHLLTDEDLVVVAANLLDVPAGAVTDPASITGTRLKRAVSAQRPISTADVEFPDAVRKGEVVTILARSQAVMIKALATAKQSGKIGQWVKVANLDSGKEIYAKVVDSGMVAVDF